MTCPNCNHVYPISNGIPNMVCFSQPTRDESLSLTVSLSSLRNMRSRSESHLSSRSATYIHGVRSRTISTSVDLVDQVRSLSELGQKLQ